MPRSAILSRMSGKPIRWALLGPQTELPWHHKEGRDGDRTGASCGLLSAIGYKSNTIQFSFFKKPTPSAFPTHDYENFQERCVTLSILGLLQILLDPHCNFWVDSCPTYSVTIVNRKKQWTALMEGQFVLIHNTGAIMLLAEGPAVTCLFFTP